MWYHLPQDGLTPSPNPNPLHTLNRGRLFSQSTGARMAQAIRTRYISPTDTRGARMVARAQAGTISIPYDSAINDDENHKAVALALIKKCKWEDFNYHPGTYNGDLYWVQGAKKPPPDPEPGNEWKEESLRLKKLGQVIAAIRHCRTQTGLSLMEAKHAVERLS